MVGSKTVVPNVVGRSVGDAQSRLATAGFKSQIFRQTNSAPVDEVFSQSPDGGQKAKKNSTIILNVSTGPGEVTMPDVAGLTQSEAVTQLESLGLKVTVNKEFSTAQSKGNATRTVPTSGDKAEKGSDVDLYVSKGAKQVVVPNVVGQDLDAATKTLENAGFKVDSSEQDSSDPQNQVEKQSPSATAKADEGSTVKLTVASGQNAVPDVTELTETDATNKLQDAGFKVKSNTVDVTDQAEDGLVQTQSPTPGTQDIGTTVTIEVGNFTAPSP
jgi:serine/threonine-protein kinase